MSKGFTPILILIILLILGGVGFLIFKSTEMNSSPTKTPAGSLVKERNSVTKESWKNYSNQKYRYTIQYPDSWHLSTSNEQLVGISSFDLSLPNTPPNNTITFEISATSSNETDFNKFVSNRYEEYKNNSLLSNIGLKEESTHVLDQSIPKEISLFNSSGKNYTLELHILKNNIRYSVVVHKPNLSTDQTIDQVLSTFRFTN